jgi:hypothetical protein
MEKAPVAVTRPVAAISNMLYKDPTVRLSESRLVKTWRQMKLLFDVIRREHSIIEYVLLTFTGRFALLSLPYGRPQIGARVVSGIIEALDHKY